MDFAGLPGDILEGDNEMSIAQIWAASPLASKKAMLASVRQSLDYSPASRIKTHEYMMMESARVDELFETLKWWENEQERLFKEHKKAPAGAGVRAYIMSSIDEVAAHKRQAFIKWNIGSTELGSDWVLQAQAVAQEARDNLNIGK
ncbi:hypothetical protein B484DRAFT_399306 [Ochromonadaceae sp. CCMP2298]|nr:hypothetical protein B484DRAFT_399306 [Ochromonadaceae sp. CCMP2298]